MSSTNTPLHRFRVWCETEGAFVYVWTAGESVPTLCPNDSSHTVDTTAAVIVETMDRNATEISNLPITPFDRMLTSEETVVIDVKSGMGLTRLRDITNEVGGGSVVSDVGQWEYHLRAQGAGSVASLRTSERGPFVSGLCAEVGIGGRLGSFPQGDQTVRYGAFDDTTGNGFFFEISSIGLFVVVMKDGEEKHRAHMSTFNVDTMDGTGPSRLELDPLRGYAWTIRYAMYGYGVVEFAVAAENIDLEQHLVPMHRYYTRSDPCISCPYLPVWAEIASPSFDGDISVFVTGRKHSVLGAYKPDTRMTHICHEIDESEGIAGTFTTVLAVRKRAECISMPVRVCGINVSSASQRPILVEIVTGTPDATTTWSSIDGVPVGESVLESVFDTDVFKEYPETVGLWRGYADATSIRQTLHAQLNDSHAIAIRVRDASQAGLVAFCLKVEECW